MLNFETNMKKRVTNIFTKKNLMIAFLVILILILLVGFLVLCAVSDSELKVERTTTINAPKAVVWEQIVHYKNWEHWNPWKEQDTTIVADVSGPDGSIGAVYHFVGKKSGEGRQTTTKVSDGEMQYEMEFLKPFQAKADGWFKLAEEGGKTKVSWYFHENLGFMWRGFMAIMGVSGMLQKSFDRGLELLKVYSETHAAEVQSDNAAMQISEADFPGHVYAGIRATVKWADMSAFFSKGYGLVGKEAGPRIAGPASALYWSWDEKNMQADAMACFPVNGKDPVKGAVIQDVPASKALLMHYVGPYSGFEAAHKAINDRLMADKKTMSLVIEEYLNDPMTEKDSTKLQTNIWYLLK